MRTVSSEAEAEAEAADRIGWGRVRDAVYRRVAWRLLPLLGCCYIIAYIDRTNVSFARSGMELDLGIGDAAYGLGISLFFFGYILFEVPSNLLMQRVGVRRTISRVLMLWGGLSMAMMFVSGSRSLYVLRFLLGAAEAGFLPCAVFYLGLWFPQAWRGRVVSRFFIAIPLAGILSGSLSGLILRSMEGALGLSGWRWLFLIEGLPPVLLGIFAFFRFDEGPVHARWLDEPSRALIVGDLAAEARTRGATGTATVSGATLLRNPRVYVVSFAYFAVLWGSSLLNFWSPAIIGRSGVRDPLAVGLLSAIPYLAGVVAMLAVGASSDRRQERRWHFGAMMAIAAIGALLLSTVQDDWLLSLGCLVLIGIGYLASIGLFWTIPGTLFRGSSAPVGIAVVSSLGQLGSATAPVFFGMMRGASGDMKSGLIVLAVILGSGGCAVIVGLPARMFACTETKSRN